MKISPPLDLAAQHPLAPVQNPHVVSDAAGRLRVRANWLRASPG